MFIIKLIGYVIKKIFPVAILMGVWFLNIRPITFIDKILAVDLMKRAQELDIKPATIGAIDVAILTFAFGIISDIFKKYFTKPIELTIKINPSNSNSDTALLKFDPDMLEKANATEISVKISGQIHKWYKFTKIVFRGIKVKIHWHPSWLSVNLGESSISTALRTTSRSGELYFDILQLFSESDDVINPTIKLYVMANNSTKDQGKIDAKVEVNSDSKLICFLFSGFLNSLIKLKVNQCRIFIEKGS